MIVPRISRRTRHAPQDRTTDQGLRPTAGPRSAGPFRMGRGRGLRPARAQRVRQIDGASPAARLPAADRRPRRHRRARLLARQRQRPPPRRLPARRTAALRKHDRPAVDAFLSAVCGQRPVDPTSRPVRPSLRDRPEPAARADVVRHEAQGRAVAGAGCRRRRWSSSTSRPTRSIRPCATSCSSNCARRSKRGQAVLFSSHVLTEVEQVCDRVAILQKGRLVHLQKMSELVRFKLVQATFAGEVKFMPNLGGPRKLPDGPGETGLRLRGSAVGPDGLARREPLIGLGKSSRSAWGRSIDTTMETKHDAHPLCRKLLGDLRIGLAAEPPAAVRLPDVVGPRLLGASSGRSCRTLNKVVATGVPARCLIQGLRQDCPVHHAAARSSSTSRRSNLMSIAYVHPLTLDDPLHLGGGPVVGPRSRARSTAAPWSCQGSADPPQPGDSRPLRVDLVTIPILGLSMWLGTYLGTWLVWAFRMAAWPRTLRRSLPLPGLSGERGRFDPGRERLLANPVGGGPVSRPGHGPGRRPHACAPHQRGSANCGSAMDWMRPYTVFYHYQPQPMILKDDWSLHAESRGCTWRFIWRRRRGYLLAWWIFCKRDPPAPL